MKKQIAIVGLGRFGTSVATTLVNMGHDVLAIDVSEKNVATTSGNIMHTIQADATNESVLKDLEIDKFDTVIVSMGTDIKSSVLTTILLKKLGVPHVVARANDELHGSILEKIGADYVVYPELEMGTRTAFNLVHRDVVDYMRIARGYGIAKLPAPAYMNGKSVREIGFGPKGELEIALLLLQRNNEVIVNPENKEIINEDDMLIISGNDENLENLLHQNEKKNGKSK